MIKGSIEEAYDLLGTLALYIVTIVSSGCIIGAILIFMRKKAGVYIFVVMYILYHVIVRAFLGFFCFFMVGFCMGIRKIYKYMN